MPRFHFVNRYEIPRKGTSHKLLGIVYYIEMLIQVHGI